jgi:hypothetical protein
VLVHRVNQPVADSPKEKQQTDENKRDDQILAVAHDKHALLVCVHGVSKMMLTTQTPAVVSKFMAAAAHRGISFMVNGLLMGLQLLEAHVSVKFFISNTAMFG